MFAVTLTAVYAVSATYHRRSTPATRDLWRRLDHSTIFLLIAGTYTPFCLLAVPSPWGPLLLSGIWIGALVGAGCKLVAFNTAGRTASVLYGVLGWAAVLSLPLVVHAVGWTPVALFVAGGLCYSLGAAVLARNWPDPLPDVFGYHEVWHAATLIAAGCHIAAIATIT